MVSIDQRKAVSRFFQNGDYEPRLKDAEFGVWRSIDIQIMSPRPVYREIVSWQVPNMFYWFLLIVKSTGTNHVSHVYGMDGK